MRIKKAIKGQLFQAAERHPRTWEQVTPFFNNVLDETLFLHSDVNRGAGLRGDVMKLLAALALSGAVAFMGLMPAANAATVTIQADYITGTGGGVLTSTNLQTFTNSFSYSPTLPTGWVQITASGNAFTTGHETTNTVDATSDNTNKTPLYLAINFQGLTGPLSSALQFVSTFQANSLLGAQTLTESTYINTGSFTLLGANTNALGTLLEPAAATWTNTTNADFNGVTSILTSSPQNASSTYSIVMLYEIDPNVTTCGSTCRDSTTANITVDALATPLPGTFPLLAGGLGFVALLRRRNKRAA